MAKIGMMNQFEYETIKVVGVGGGGCNSVHRMIESGLDGVDFIAINTDYQSLEKNFASKKIQIGVQATKGLGTGSNYLLGEKAALENEEQIREQLEGAHLVFITAGMGGGTGTGAAPIIAKIAKDMGCLTVSIVTTPFVHEGKRKKEIASLGIANFQDKTDALIVVSNENLLSASTGSLTLLESFHLVDDVLKQAISGVLHIIQEVGVMNVDFADVRMVLQNAGQCMIGSGQASGKDRAMVAAQIAMHNPLLETNSEGAEAPLFKNLLVNVTSSSNLELVEYKSIVEYLEKYTAPDAQIVLGAYISESMEESISITLIGSLVQLDDQKGGIAVPQDEAISVSVEAPEMLDVAMSVREEKTKEEAVMQDTKQDVQNVTLSEAEKRAAFVDMIQKTNTLYDILDNDTDMFHKLEIPTFQRKKTEYSG